MFSTAIFKASLLSLLPGNDDDLYHEYYNKNEDEDEDGDDDDDNDDDDDDDDDNDNDDGNHINDCKDPVLNSYFQS